MKDGERREENSREAMGTILFIPLLCQGLTMVSIHHEHHHVQLYTPTGFAGTSRHKCTCGQRIHRCFGETCACDCVSILIVESTF